MTSRTPTVDPPRVFPNTRWSVVLAATGAGSGDSVHALEAICRAYWYPLYAYVRRSGQSAHDAQDLTQEFFQHLLEKRWLNDADREKGKLRTFLVVALKRFMAKEWRRASAERRGGGRSPVQVDTTFAESRYAVDHSSLEPGAAFDRQWALTLLDRTVHRLREEFVSAGKESDFETLKSTLMVGRGAIDCAAIAARLQLNEGAARVAVHRLRKRFREIYREEISQTLADGEDLETELRHLANVLARR